jgi:hypothetical protein
VQVYDEANGPTSVCTAAVRKPPGHDGEVTLVSPHLRPLDRAACENSSLTLAAVSCVDTLRPAFLDGPSLYPSPHGDLNMATQTLDQLTTRANSLQGQYSYAFANKPRATRQLDLLDKIIADTREVLTGARSHGQRGQTLVNTLNERLTMYQSERSEIQKAQSRGPAAMEAAILATRANFVFFQYRTHFAGQNRATRDKGLLQDMVTTLTQIRDAYEGLAITYPQSISNEDREVISNNLRMYTNEMGEITRAQEMGTPDEQASALANVANSQFELYRVHFAGKSRLSRRPALINRCVATLEDAKRRMLQLKSGGLTAEYNDKNIAIVTERLDAYMAEQVAIAEQRATTTFDALVDALATAANSVMEEYASEFAGKNRASRELKKLANLFDQLFEIERQMTDLTQQFDSSTNLKNLLIVQDALMVYSVEFDAIEKAQKAAKS